MKDTKTTIAGLVAAVLPWLKTIMPDYALLFDSGATFALALFAYFAKDK